MINNFSVKMLKERKIYRGFIIVIFENPPNEHNVSHVMIYKDNEDEDFVDCFEAKVGEEYNRAKEKIFGGRYD